MGVMITKADERKNYFKETLKTLNEAEDVRVFKTYVKVDSAIEWSQDNSKPVVAYKKYSRSALEYKNLAKEVVEYANR
jgi:chromosome partitioning protein